MFVKEKIEKKIKRRDFKFTKGLKSEIEKINIV